MDSARVQVKLTPENERRIAEYIATLAIKASPTAVANFIISQRFEPNPKYVIGGQGSVVESVMLEAGKP